MYDHLMYIAVNATPFKLRYNDSQMTGIQSTEALQHSNKRCNLVISDVSQISDTESSTDGSPGGRHGNSI